MRWRFKLQKDYIYKLSEPHASKITHNLAFLGSDEKDKLQLMKGGYIRVLEGYAWDGNSPKFSILDLFWIGTPDGVMDVHTQMSVTAMASLVHDTLGQFKLHKELPFRKSERDLIFLTMLRAKKFKLSWLYYLAVVVLGVPYEWYQKVAKKVREDTAVRSIPDDEADEILALVAQQGFDH